MQMLMADGLVESENLRTFVTVNDILAIEIFHNLTTQKLY